MKHPRQLFRGIARPKSRIRRGEHRSARPWPCDGSALHSHASANDGLVRLAVLSVVKAHIFEEHSHCIPHTANSQRTEVWSLYDIW